MLYKLLTNEKRWFIIYHAFGDMAQLVERYVRNVQATSSNLVISTTLYDEKGAFYTLLFLFSKFFHPLNRTVPRVSIFFLLAGFLFYYP